MAHIRRSQATLNDSQKGAFREAFNTLNSRGEFGPIAEIHGQPHRMHGNVGPIGTQRFLAWHRVYLVKFEQALQNIDSSVFLPYWDWKVDRQIPEWLENLKPSVLLGTQPLQVVRNPGDPNKLPVAQQVQELFTRDTFTHFTSEHPSDFPPGGTPGLESIHNGVHRWFPHSTMNDIPTASADPIFWMHHANVDRIWAIWQTLQPTQVPTLTPTDNDPVNILDPWTVDETATRNSPVSLGYTYSLTRVHLEAEFRTTAEAQLYGPPKDRDFVASLYWRYLAQPPDAGSEAYLNQLASGQKTRDQLEKEFRDKNGTPNNHNFTVSLYWRYLGHGPDSFFDYHLSRITDGQ